jgi:hypothetical protein
VGVDAVIDVTNIQARDAEATRILFGTATRNLLAAEQRARVRHHVLGSPILNAMMKQGCCKNRRSMCGRYARTKAEILAEFFEFAFLVEEIAPRFNIAPTTQIPVARLRDDGQRELIALR